MTDNGFSMTNYLVAERRGFSRRSLAPKPAPAPRRSRRSGQLKKAESHRDQILTFNKDVKLEKPDASQFDVADGLTKYDSMQTTMMQEMMKRAGSMRGRGQ
jgi:hypothetical protein